MKLDRVHLLIVDDDRNTREMLAEVLSMHGAKVLTAESASEAQRILHTWRPDVIVSDLGMPEMDGYDFMRDLRTWPAESGGTTPAIAVSGYTQAEDQRRALAAGYQSFLPKPVDVQELIASILTIN